MPFLQRHTRQSLSINATQPDVKETTSEAELRRAIEPPNFKVSPNSEGRVSTGDSIHELSRSCPMQTRAKAAKYQVHYEDIKSASSLAPLSMVDYQAPIVSRLPGMQYHGLLTPTDPNLYPLRTIQGINPTPPPTPAGSEAGDRPQLHSRITSNPEHPRTRQSALRSKSTDPMARSKTGHRAADHENVAVFADHINQQPARPSTGHRNWTPSGVSVWRRPTPSPSSTHSSKSGTAITSDDVNCTPVASQSSSSRPGCVSPPVPRLVRVTPSKSIHQRRGSSSSAFKPLREGDLSSNDDTEPGESGAGETQRNKRPRISNTPTGVEEPMHEQDRSGGKRRKRPRLKLSKMITRTQKLHDADQNHRYHGRRNVTHSPEQQMMEPPLQMPMNPLLASPSASVISMDAGGMDDFDVCSQISGEWNARRSLGNFGMSNDAQQAIRSWHMSAKYTLSAVTHPYTPSPQKDQYGTLHYRETACFENPNQKQVTTELSDNPNLPKHQEHKYPLRSRQRDNLSTDSEGDDDPRPHESLNDTKCRRQSRGRLSVHSTGKRGQRKSSTCTEMKDSPAYTSQHSMPFAEGNPCKSGQAHPDYQIVTRRQAQLFNSIESSASSASETEDDGDFREGRFQEEIDLESMEKDAEKV